MIDVSRPGRIAAVAGPLAAFGLVWGLVALCASQARADASANVDWQRRVITARGQGAPDLNAPNPAAARIGAERAAQLDALRNILETLKGVQIKGGQTAGQLMAQDSALKASVEGEVRNFKVIDRKYFSDGGVALTVEMSLDGKVAELFLPLAPALQKTASQGSRDVGSGLVIVAKGLKVSPALAPRIFDEAGKELYGPEFVLPGALRTNGIAGYLSSESAAQRSGRVGEHPLTLKAVKAQGSDLTISAADAAKLTDGQANLGFLAEGKVIIVVD